MPIKNPSQKLNDSKDMCKVKTNIQIIQNIPYISLVFDGRVMQRYEFWGDKEKENLYEDIFSKKPIKLNKVFIDGLSMQEYRNRYGIQKDEMLEIFIDYITECCFSGSGNYAFDFAYCRFIAANDEIGFLLDDNCFINGKVDFSYSEFGNQDFSMKGCTFIDSNIYFSFSRFGDKDFYLNEIDFFNSDCTAIFHGTDFGESGEIDFCNIHNLYGMFDFYRCMFGQNSINFSCMNCPNGDFVFFEVDTPMKTIDFIDSFVNLIIFYRSYLNGLVDLRVSEANHIILQESIIRDCVLLGNEGYKNYTSYCLKKSTILGRIKISNKFSYRLFDRQLQYTYDPETDNLVLCPTSFTDKSSQLIMISENYQSEGESDNADQAYVLSKRYRNKGRVQDLWTSYSSVNRNEKYNNSIMRKCVAHTSITINLIITSLAFVFEKVILDMFCGSYATKPAKFLFWIVTLICGFSLLYYPYFSNNLSVISDIKASVLYSLQVFLQIDVSGIIAQIGMLGVIVAIEKVIGLVIFSLFAVSYTRKVIK